MSLALKQFYCHLCIRMFAWGINWDRIASYISKLKCGGSVKSWLSKMTLYRNHREHEMWPYPASKLSIFWSESSRTRDESSDPPLAPLLVTNLLSFTKSWGLSRPRLSLSSAPRAASKKVKLRESRVRLICCEFEKKSKRPRSLGLA